MKGEPLVEMSTEAQRAAFIQRGAALLQTISLYKSEICVTAEETELCGQCVNECTLTV